MAASLSTPAPRRALFRIVLLILVLCELGICASSLHKSLAGNVDFRAFYAAGHLVGAHAGKHLYDYSVIQDCERSLVGADGPTLPFLYPPVAAVAFVPFSFLSYKAAFLVFLLCNLALLLCAIRVLFDKTVESHGISFWLAAGLAFCLLPVAIALMQGQITFVLLLIFAGAWRLLRDRRPLLAGLLLSAALVKFQFALPLIFLMACWKQWRVVAGWLAGAVAIVGLSAWIAGWSGLRVYLASLFQITHAALADPQKARASYGMFAGDMPNLHGLLFTLTGGTSHAGTLLVAIISGLVILWGMLQRPSLPVALGVALLVSYHMQPYDLTLLIVVAAGYLQQLQGTVFSRRSATIVASFALLAVPIALLLLMLHATCWYGLATVWLTWAVAEPRLEGRSYPAWLD